MDTKVEPQLHTILRIDHNNNKHNKSTRYNCPLCPQNGEEQLSNLVEAALRSRSGNYGYE